MPASLRPRWLPYFICLIVACQLLSIKPSHAQSVDDCMSARLADALTICQSLIDQGSRNVDVYWRITSALYQDGQIVQSKNILSDALRLHPRNEKLETLKQIISTDATEQQLLAESARRNQSSMDRGALKIACLTKSADVGISACQRYLELTNEGGARIQDRLDILQSAQRTSQLATAQPESEKSTVSGSDIRTAAESVNKTETALTVDSQRTDDFTARQSAYKQLVKSVQSGLNNLGFIAGTADGVPGDRTRTALRDFYSATQQPVQNTISEQTLADLDAAQVQLNVAEELLQQSQQALQSGNAILAQAKLSEAENSSLLLVVPPALKTKIEAGLDSFASNQGHSVPQPPNETSQQAVVPTELTLPDTTSTSTSTSTVKQAAEATTSVQQPEFDQLMTRIETMQFAIQQMQRQQSILIENMREPVR